MKKQKIHRLGDLQLRIMQVLWEGNGATVSQVLEALPDSPDLAYTTIATMLRKMETRGLVAHRVEGRTFIYHAKVAAAEGSQSMADDLVNRLFEGSSTETVSHLLGTRGASRDELSKLERLIVEGR